MRSLGQSLRSFAALAVALLVSACATSPYNPSVKAESDKRLQAQIAKAADSAKAAPGGKLWYAGFALNDTSHGFVADVDIFGKALESINPAVLKLQLANPVIGSSTPWPYATRENVETTLKAIGEQALSNDTIVVLLTTHGNVDFLSVTAGNQNLPGFRGDQLASALRPLAGKRTIVLVSACHSGSLISALRNPMRVVATAARADRNSFGCQLLSDNTYFVAEIIRAMKLKPEASLKEVLEQAKINIDAREKTMRLSPPSEPQIWIGPAAQGTAQTSFKELLNPR